MWLKGMAVATLVVSAALSTPARAQAPEPYAVTPDLEEAAREEGQVIFYTATDVAVAEKLAEGFRAKYPGINVQVERAGSERIFQRIGQEYMTGIYNADVIETSDAVHFNMFKREGWLQAAVPEEVAREWPADERDRDGYFAAYRAHLSVIAYNRDALGGTEPPRSFADLVDPRFKDKLVKAHPGYSGTIMTATFVLSQALGWEYFEKLGQQNVMQVQSSTEPPKKLAQGERAVEIDGNEYNLFRLIEEGAPLEIVYAEEGTPLVVGNAGILANAPHPNAAKLFYSYLFSLEAQQLNSDFGGLRSFHPGVKEKAGRTPLSEIELLHSDPEKLEPEIETIKSNYELYFGT
ncbi:extracellular solute-binding protein [Marinivivus vitaminiproducens]|uniref:extracellular solute-binding protein n=1 Tax=Marinivivus vitaminiproducens TaxID=3035935 RepID=UPI00279E36E7|nr:extracellular solute-binding protein [Geminicoccaceae bacterium SCSIO 64248]